MPRYVELTRSRSVPRHAMPPMTGNDSAMSKLNSFQLPRMTDPSEVMSDMYSNNPESDASEAMYCIAGMNAITATVMSVACAVKYMRARTTR